MKIIAIYTHNVGPLNDDSILLKNDWTEETEKQVLFTGVNGCGKSTLLRAIAMLWDATGYWLDHQKTLPRKHEAFTWLTQWAEGIVVVVDGVQPLYEQPLAFVFGTTAWIATVKAQHPNAVFLGETVKALAKSGSYTRTLDLPQGEWLVEWCNHRRKMMLSYDNVDAPNMIYLDAEERRWVKPKRNIAEPLPELLSQRWLSRYIVSEDWKGQLEASLITLKTTQLHRFHEIIRYLNGFLMGKEIVTDIQPNEGRLRVKIAGKRGVYHYLDELSSGEHQVLIIIYVVSRWMQNGSVVLIDEPDLYVHPSLVSPLLTALEQLVVAERNGQLLITSHATDVWQRYEHHGVRVELGSQNASS
ncbi:MAG: ATP-binding protein [Mariprofundaceae bacterium]|nr:ATP-binding protein [Mariprofundaceae bacterium]